MPDRGTDGGIEEYRRRIDGIDDQLVELLNERAKNVLAIAAIKASEHKHMFDITREGAILNRVREVNAGPLNNRELGKVFLQVMDVGRQMQRRLESQEHVIDVTTTQDELTDEIPS